MINASNIASHIACRSWGLKVKYLLYLDDAGVGGRGLRLLFTCRDQREKFLITYEEANTDTPPFTDLFQGEVRDLLLSNS